MTASPMDIGYVNQIDKDIDDMQRIIENKCSIAACNRLLGWGYTEIEYPSRSKGGWGIIEGSYPTLCEYCAGDAERAKLSYERNR